MSTDANLGTVLSVDTPDFFRVSDNVEIAFVPLSTLAMTAKAGQDVIELVDKTLDIVPGLTLQINDGGSPTLRHSAYEFGQRSDTAHINPSRDVHGHARHTVWGVCKDHSDQRRQSQV